MHTAAFFTPAIGLGKTERLATVLHEETALSTRRWLTLSWTARGTVSQPNWPSKFLQMQGVWWFPCWFRVAASKTVCPLTSGKVQKLASWCAVLCRLQRKPLDRAMLSFACTLAAVIWTPKVQLHYTRTVCSRRSSPHAHPRVLNELGPFPRIHFILRR